MKGIVLMPSDGTVIHSLSIFLSLLEDGMSFKMRQLKMIRLKLS